MSAPVAMPLPLPDVAQLRPHQQMAMECAHCARYLGASGRILGDVHHLGLLFRLWVCAPNCRTANSTVPNT
ncbi:hypothetical protein [Streptomyces sp. NPDC002276]